MSDKCYECESELSVVCVNCNTRAVPDVPELVRISVTALWGETISNVGEYVRHDQAAAIIAAKDAEIERLENSNAHWINENRKNLKNGQTSEAKNTELEAAWLNAEGKISDLEAKLAQYEAQEPVGYIIKHHRFTDDFQTYELSEGDISNGYTQVPLYASPAPAADLKAENAKMLSLVQNITKFYIGSPEHFRAVYDARNALNPSEPQT